MKKTFLEWSVADKEEILRKHISEVMKFLWESKEEFYGEVKIC